MENKLISIDFEAVKEKTAAAAKSTASKAKAKLVAAGKVAGDKAKAGRNKAVASLLEKGIELSEKQLKVLENARKSL